jgi:hypothetical protein
MAKIVKTILSPDQLKAGDRFVEGRHRQREQLRNQISQFESYTAPDGDADITKQEVQMGRPLHRREIMRRLFRLNPNLRYEQALADPLKGGIYSIENRINPATGKAPWKRFVCGIPHERVTEFHIPCTVEQTVPAPDLSGDQIVVQRLNGHIPGWRAVLLKLLKDNLVTPAGIDREFKITQGRDSAKWQAATSIN